MGKVKRTLAFTNMYLDKADTFCTILTNKCTQMPFNSKEYS